MIIILIINKSLIQGTAFTLHSIHMWFAIELNLGHFQEETSAKSFFYCHFKCVHPGGHLCTSVIITIWGWGK